MKFSLPKTNSESGFTLIELLVVISIISLLSSVVLVATNNARIKARDAVRKSTLKQLQTALEMYYQDHNSSYPLGSWLSSESSSCGPSVPGCLVDSPGNFIPGLVPQYISALPHDPSAKMSGMCTDWKQAYVYVSNGTDYKLMSHCGYEEPISHSDPMVDPVRDCGSNASIVDGSDPCGWAIAVYSPGAVAW